MRETAIGYELAERGSTIIQTNGISMEPMLHEHSSSVILELPSRPLRRYDVVLFARPNGDLVLHRIVRLLPDGSYIICGDNSLQLEHVPRDWIMGVVTGYYPDASDRFVPYDTPAPHEQGIPWWLNYGRRRALDLVKQVGKKCLQLFENR